MAILDYPEQIKDYLQAHFAPSDPDRANFRKTTNELLGFLSQVFPAGCISDYDLAEILTDLGYNRHQWPHENFYEEGEGKEKVIKVSRHLATGWCLKSDFDLRDDEYQAP